MSDTEHQPPTRNFILPLRTCTRCRKTLNYNSFKFRINTGTFYKVCIKCLSKFKCDKCDYATPYHKKIVEHKSREHPKLSAGDKAIKEIVEAMGLNYQHKYTTNKYKFDGLIVFNGLKLFIEYNGKQHYQIAHEGKAPTKKEIAAFKKLHSADVEKFNYCKNNGHPLLVIPYYKFGKIKELVADFIILNTTWGYEA